MITKEDLFGKCPYTTAQKILSGKWAIIILRYLSEDKLRFNELQKRLPEITQTTLTRQLRALEEYGMITRIVHAQVPPKVEYELSEIGESFSTVLNDLKTWGEEYIDFYNERMQEENNLKIRP